MDTIFGIIRSLIEQYGADYPWVVSIIAVVGTFRLVVKPIITAIEKIVRETATTKDDEVLERVQRSPIYAWFFYVLDWLTSIKIPPRKKP